jgi:hypothetical protein
MAFVIATVYELDWSGIGSEVFFLVCCLALAAGFVLSMRVIIRAAMDLRRRGSTMSGWANAASILFIWVSLILLAVSSILSARTGSGSSGSLANTSTGALSGYSRNASRGSGRWLAISLLAAPLCVGLFLTCVLREQPLRLEISKTQIGIFYRLPWRNFTIPLSAVSSVELQRHDFMNRSIPDYYYELEIEHDGVTTAIQCNHRAWYENQLHNAYNAILAQTKNSKPLRGSE